MINLLTTNRLVAIFVGIVITMIIQSSSVTTVMIVSFVNAGLMNLTQAIGIIFGANIGTTVTGWIIAIKIGKYGLVGIGLGIFPMLFSKEGYLKNTGKLLFALGLVFFGLELMSLSFKPLRTNEEFLSLLSHFSADTLPSILGCILMGTILTTMIQSSSAMLGITIALGATGVISFQTAAALILGENIGTTITAFLASFTGNTNAKRAARAHTIFNILGVIIVVSVFHRYVHFVDWLVMGNPDAFNAAGNKPCMATHIAAAHSVFNICATLLFIPFLNPLAKLVTLIVPDTKHEEKHRLTMLGNPYDIAPELAIEQASRELEKMSSLVRDSIKLSAQYIGSDTQQSDAARKVNKYEAITDNIEKEIFLFMNTVLSTSLTEAQTLKASGIIRASDELESISDYCDSLIRYRKRLFETGETFSPTRKNLLNQFLHDTLQFFDYTCKPLTSPDTFDNTLCLKTYANLNERADEIREIHLKRTMDNGKEHHGNPLTALTFSDMIVALRRIKNHSLNLAQALSGGKQNN